MKGLARKGLDQAKNAFCVVGLSVVVVGESGSKLEV